MRSSPQWASATWRKGLTELGVLLGMSYGLASCGTVEPVAPAAGPVTDPTQLYMSLTLNYPAVNLATAVGYDTVHLIATPRDAAGNPMSNLPAPTFTSSDTSKVRVTADGRLTAVGTVTAPGAIVTATLTSGPVTHRASSYVQVLNVPSPPRLATLSVHPVPPDSAVWWGQWVPSFFVGPTFLSFYGINNGNPVASAVDSNGNPLTGLIYDYVSLDSAVATFDRQSGYKNLLKPGQVRLVARTYAYGIAKADTATYTVRMPLVAGFFLDALTGFASLDKTEIRIAPGGFVGWQNGFGADSPTGDTVAITFDDPTNVAAPPPPSDACDLYSLFFVEPCGAGNGILVDNWDADFFGNGLIIRQFPLPGIYPFHTNTGAAGRVVVIADPFNAE